MKFLSEFFSEFQLTKSQTEAVSAIQDFLANSEQNVFILKGYAGTGKTFLTLGITKYLRGTSRTFVLAAPTGKAARVLSYSSGCEASTIHRTIYGSPQISYDPSFRLVSSVKLNLESDNAVYLIDESSMISNEHSDDGLYFAGTGHLLNDLLRYVDIQKSNRKIIFIGDGAQLPPINTRFSPALSESYLSKQFNLRCVSYTMEEIVRQKEESLIIKIADKFRIALNDKNYNFIHLETNGKDVIYADSDDVLSIYLDANSAMLTDRCAIICRTNKKALDYNLEIHNKFFPGENTVQPGELLMVVENNLLHDYSNGSIVKVEEVLSDSIIRKITLKNKNEETGKTETKVVSLSFREVRLTEQLPDSTEIKKKVLILENLINSKEPSITGDLARALYVDFRIRNQHLKTEVARSKAIRDDIYFNSVRVKFGYAFTCHKAQGSEWSTVIVDCADKNQHCENYFRWLYTAITRASNRLILINKPAFTEGLKPVDPNPRVDFPSQLKEKVEALLNPLNIQVENISHKQYNEIYTFRRGEEYARINIFYKNTNKVSKISPVQPIGLGLEIADLLKRELVKTSLDSSVFNAPSIKEFHKFIESKCSENDFTILSTQPMQWCLRYEISDKTNTEKVDFYYDAKGNFTKVRFVSQASSDLKEKLSQCFEKWRI